MKSPIRLNKTQSIIFTTIYLGITLFWRFMVQPQLYDFYLISIGIGVFFLVFLWSLFYIKFLNFSSTEKKESSG